MKVKLVIDGNAVYEIDEDCLECKKHHAECEEKQTAAKRMEESVKNRKRNTPSI